MRPVLSLLAGLVVWVPAIAFAEGAGGSYRGIASIYFTLMWAILCYGVYDVFGKKALYVGGPLLALGTYMMLPPG
jgi:hypothetical protein